MRILKSSVILCALVCSSIALNGDAHAQTGHEVFANDLIHKRGDSPADAAIFFVELGQFELDRLNDLAPLDESLTLRKNRLEIAMSPLIDLLAVVGTKNAWPGIGDELISMYTSDELASSIYQALGHEGCEEVCAIRMSATLTRIIDETKDSAVSATTFLSNDKFAKMLDLTDGQRKKIEVEVAKTTANLKQKDSALFEQLKQFSDARWNKILAQLDTKQQRLAKDLVGEPVEWFRTFGEQPIRYRDFLGGGIFFLPQLQKEKDGKRLIEMTPAQLEKHGIDFLHGHVFEMMKSPFVWGELEFTKDQKQNFSSNEMLQKELVVLPNFAEERLRQLLTGNAECPSLIKKVLLEHQCELFIQIELQFLLGKHESVGILNQRMIERLDIGEAQISNMQVVVNQYLQESEGIFKSLASRRENIKSEFKEELSTILTKQQREMFKKFVGVDLVDRGKQEKGDILL
jgi:hypothetical protein